MMKDMKEKEMDLGVVSLGGERYSHGHKRFVSLRTLRALLSIDQKLDRIIKLLEKGDTNE